MAKKYTDEMVSYVRELSPTTPRKEIARLFNERFNTSVSIESIRWICRTNGINSARKYEIGDEFFTAGEWRVLTSKEPKLDMLQRSEYKKRVIWREAYGEIPKNHCFVYLDGDKRNCTLDNLALIPLLWMRIMNKNGWLKGNREVTLTAIEWCKLHYSLSVKDGKRYVMRNGERYR